MAWDGLRAVVPNTLAPPFLRKMSPRCESLAALMGDDALSKAMGVEVECELMDNCRTMEVGDCPTEDMDCR